MNKTLITSTLLCGSLFMGTPALAADNYPLASPQPSAQVQAVSSTQTGSQAGLPPQTEKPTQVLSNAKKRLAGATSIETAGVIAEEYAKEKVKNIILTTGTDFADALSASVLSYEKEAPLRLVGESADQSGEAFAYIQKHLDLKGTVYILGGPGVIATEFEAKLHSLGYKNIVRIAGSDRYATSFQVAQILKDKTPQTVVLASGEQFPDALSISSAAAYLGWPILLTPNDKLPDYLERYLLEKKPAKLYLAGGSGAISDSVLAEIQRLVPKSTVERLSGATRFETNALIAETFTPNPSTVYLATGYHFADALAGSVLAAQKGNPILFVDPSQSTLPKGVVAYLAKKQQNAGQPYAVALGGIGAVPEELLKAAEDLISGAVKATSLHVIPDLTVTVVQNQVYALPATIPALLYNSETHEVPVIWKQAAANTNRVGTHEYEGTVAGYAKPVKLRLIVKEPPPIAEYSTYFDASQANRSENIRLAAKVLDGKLLAPGERFSFNQSVGERTAKAGYKEALIIEGDAYTPGLGGGICQVSSSLYNAATQADLEIVERHRHTLPVNYVPPGRDATVAYPFLDFKFRNSTKYSLLIRSIVEQNSLTFQLFKKV